VSDPLAHPTCARHEIITSSHTPKHSPPHHTHSLGSATTLSRCVAVSELTCEGEGDSPGLLGHGAEAVAAYEAPQLGEDVARVPPGNQVHSDGRQAHALWGPPPQTRCDQNNGIFARWL
jgi:hypothetical protein